MITCLYFVALVFLCACSIEARKTLKPIPNTSHYDMSRKVVRACYYMIHKLNKVEIFGLQEKFNELDSRDIYLEAKSRLSKVLDNSELQEHLSSGYCVITYHDRYWDVVGHEKPNFKARERAQKHAISLIDARYKPYVYRMELHMDPCRKYPGLFPTFYDHEGKVLLDARPHTVRYRVGYSRKGAVERYSNYFDFSRLQECVTTKPGFIWNSFEPCK